MLNFKSREIRRENVPEEDAQMKLNGSYEILAFLYSASQAPAQYRSSLLVSFNNNYNLQFPLLLRPGGGGTK